VEKCIFTNADWFIHPWNMLYVAVEKMSKYFCVGEIYTSKLVKRKEKYF